MKKIKLGYIGKQVLAYAGVLSIFVLVLIYLAYTYVMDVSEKNAAINQEQLMLSTLNQVESYFDEVQSVARQVAQDSKIINVFQRLQDEQADEPGNHFESDILESVEIASVLAGHNGPYMSVWRISVSNMYGDYISTGASVEPYSTVEENLEPFVIEEIVMPDIENSGVGYIIYGPESDRWSGAYDDTYISFIMPITNYYGTETYGLVEVQQTTDKLEAALAMDVLTDMDAYLLNELGEQIFPVVEDESAGVDFNRSGVHVTTSQTSYGWSVSLVQDRAQMLAPYRSLLYYLFAGGLAIFALLLVSVYLIARRLSAPIIGLSRQVQNVSLDNMPTDLVTTEATDEVKELEQAFNGMLQRLGDSLNYEKKAYLLALQSQMDPHFLYNSLSVISSMGVEAGSDKIVLFCKRLSALLRYSSSYDTKPVTLRDELDNVKNYMELMALRFEEDFTFTIESDPAVSHVQLPRLVLQPIVENCFEHAFRSVSPPWHIDIRTGQTEEGWFITVADNGAGFDREKLDILERRIDEFTRDLPANYAELKIGGLGLANTIIRLRLSANTHVDYTITPNEPRGTVVTLKGARNDSGSDR